MFGALTIRESDAERLRAGSHPEKKSAIQITL
jgi:hypothetical protein